MLFKPDFEEIDYLDLSEETGDPKEFIEFIKSFPSLYRASPEFAKSLCKSTTAYAIFEGISLAAKVIAAHEKFQYCSIDTRITMLKTGWYPCIPGWHCDDFYRPSGEQPAISRCEEEAPMDHYMFQLGDCCHTEFVVEPIELPDENELDFSRGSLYGQYNDMIENLNPKTVKMKTNTLIKFSQTALHRGTSAQKDGWRLFLRATFSNTRPPLDEERRQTQVYLSAINAGW